MQLHYLCLALTCLTVLVWAWIELGFFLGRIPGCGWTRLQRGARTCFGHPWLLHNLCRESRSLDLKWLLRNSPTPPHPPGMEEVSPEPRFLGELLQTLWIMGPAISHFQAPLDVETQGAIYVESGSVISLRARVRTPGPQGQAVNPALRDTGSTCCCILLAEGGPHKYLFNSQLILNNAAGPVKSTEMKTCEAIKLRFLGWWQRWKGFRETMCFLSYMFCDRALGVPLLTVLLRGGSQPDLPGRFHADPACSCSSTESGLASKTWRPVSQMDPSLCAQPLLFPLTRSRAVPGALYCCQEPMTSFILLIITIYSQMDGQMDTHMTELCLKSIPLFSHPSFPHPQFSHLLICSLSGKEGQSW